MSIMEAIEVESIEQRVIRIVRDTAEASTDACSVQGIHEKMAEAIGVLVALIERGHGLSGAVSGGKDSTVGLILLLEAIRVAKMRGIRQAKHYVTSSSTGIENPAMEGHLLEIHAELEAFVEANDLPLDVKLVKPTLASGFVVSTIGRGTLPRFPENGVKRACAQSWKVEPQQRLVKELSAEAQRQGFKEIVAIVSTRSSESAGRATRMAERRESATEPVRDAAGHLVLSPIAGWSLQDVWDMLALFMEPGQAPFETFTDGASVYRLFDLYREANEGACGINLGDGGNKSPCGSRFGCAFCTITGESDKSMESMLREEKHSWMQGLNDFRNLLIRTQHDYGKRELIGRTVSAAGYLPVRPDVYSLSFRRDLLAYLLTLDALEMERAEQLEADIIGGKVADTRDNWRMATPQFEMVSLEQLVAIEFQWSLHPFSMDAFSAIHVWYEVHHLGRRFKIPKDAKTPKTPVPAKRWFEVGRFNKDAPTDGLRDYGAELWNPYLHPERPLTKRSINGKPSVWFTETDMLSVDAEKAYNLVEMVYPEKFVELRMHSALDGGRFLLNEEIVRLPAGMASRYQYMAERGQYFAHLSQRLNLAPVALDAHLLANSITDAEHSELLDKLGAKQEEEAQAALF